MNTLFATVDWKEGASTKFSAVRRLKSIILGLTVTLTGNRNSVLSVRIGVFDQMWFSRDYFVPIKTLLCLYFS